MENHGSCDITSPKSSAGSTGVLFLLGKGVGVEKGYSVLQLPGAVNRKMAFSVAQGTNLHQGCCEPVVVVSSWLPMALRILSHLGFLQTSCQIQAGYWWTTWEITSEKVFGKLLSHPNVSSSFLTLCFNTLLVGNISSTISAMKPRQDVWQRFPKISLFP